MYNLYNGKLKLEFLYSNYEKSEEANHKNHSNYVLQIYKLINKYSLESHNEANLLHRLLLEGRILIKNI